MADVLTDRDRYVSLMAVPEGGLPDGLWSRERSVSLTTRRRDGRVILLLSPTS